MKLRVAVVVTIALIASMSARAQISSRQSLIEAIAYTRAQGIDIIWSSRLVKPWMRVRTTPVAGSTVDALKAVLAEYSLTLEAGPQGQWLVVEGAKTAPVQTGPEPVPAGNPKLVAQRATRIDEVKIVASRYALFDRNAGSEQFLTREEIKVLPHIADDAFRAFHRLPGAAASDFSAPFNLRGGASGEVKVLLDGLEVFEPYHMRALFNPLSIIDPGIIDSAQVLSGGFTAEHGNYMSGVLDITSRWPDTEPVHELGVSFVNTFFRSAGRLGDKGIYQVAARRGYLDLLADSVTEEGEELSPRYSDFFAKVGYQVSDSTLAAVHVLHASDDVEFVDPEDLETIFGDSSVSLLWLNLETDIGERWQWRNTISTGSIENTEQGGSRVADLELIQRFYDRDVKTTSLKSEWDWRISDAHQLAFGVRLRQLDAEYDYHLDSKRQNSFVNNQQPVLLKRDVVTSRDGDETGVFARYRWSPTARSIYEVGARWDKQTYLANDDSQFSPRANALFALSDQTELRLGWGYFYQPQGIHELQVEDGVTHYFPAERAEHRVVGLSHQYDSGVSLQLDLYQKSYSDLRPRYENALDTYEVASESNFDRVRIAPERAQANGLEVTLRNRADAGFNWWVNYTWSEVEDVISGVKVPRSWDQRHAVTTNLSWQWKKWSLSMVGRYHSGWPRTPLLIDSVLDDLGNLIGVDTNLTQRNQRHFDEYFRVDLRLTRTVPLTRGSFQYYFEIFNVLDTENQCCVPDHDVNFGTVVTVQPNIDDYLPLFPSFGFVWTFGAGAN